jgi:hypothetical protein
MNLAKTCVLMVGLSLGFASVSEAGPLQRFSARGKTVAVKTLGASKKVAAGAVKVAKRGVKIAVLPAKALKNVVGCNQ